MAFRPSITTSLLILTVILVLLPVETHAFGAGDIPDFAFLNDKAFRHGDIENVLETLAKTAGRAAIGGSGIIGIAASVIKAATGPSKFNKSDIKKVYFGNWLRDYSQAMDIAGLSKLSADTLVLVVAILGFMTFGFSTEEFQVTANRLGVYLPVEHIDNPKGYAEKEGDARSYHAKLRPPVDPRELEVDPRTGMKKYMATEGQGWDTSTAFIRRTFRACIEAGRHANGTEGADLWEAYRLLGTGLHTMEDLLAHSNWCELALRKIGHKQVFCHVGDNVTVNTPNGPAPPLVTGTFGGADFLHSLLGEAGDKLSQASVTDLSNKINEASQGNNNSPNIGAIKGLLSQIMGSNSSEEKLSQGEQIQAQSQAYNFDPNNVAPPEVQKQLLDLLKWHDDVMRDILAKIQMVPGLTTLLEEFTNALNAYIYTILAPYLTPILTQATSALNEGSKAVINNEDQYEVFDNPRASDPSHSLLSKDHFGLILNEPAGKIAQILVEHSVNLIVQAWSDDSNADRVIDQILEAFHHPYYATGQSQIQHKMFNHMQAWLGGLGPDEAKQTIQALTKESVRNHKNKRLGSEDQDFEEPGYAGCSHGGSASKYSGGGTASGGYSGSKPQQSKPQPSYGSEYGSGNTGYKTQTSSGQGRQGGRPEVYGSGRQETTGYGRQEEGYGAERQETFGQGRQESRQEGYGAGRQETSGYGRKEVQQEGYGTGRQETSAAYGRQESYSSNRTEEKTYGDSDSRTEYGQGLTQQTEAYGQGYSSRHDNDKYDSGRTGEYGRKPEPVSSYGGGGGYGVGTQSGRRDDDNSPRRDTGGQTTYGAQTAYRGQAAYGASVDTSSGYGRQQETTRRDKSPQGYGGGKNRDDDDDKPKKYGGESYKRDDDDDKRKQYGGGGGRRDDDDDDEAKKYGGGGGRRNDDDDDKSKKYGGHKRDDSEDKPKKYGGYGKTDDSDEDKKKYGKKNRDSDSDDDSRKKKVSGGREQRGLGSTYGRESERGGYGGGNGGGSSYGGQGGYGGAESRGGGQGGYGGRKADDDKHGGRDEGYAPSYGGNETFGAERMRISRDSDDDSDEKKRNKHHGGNRY